MKTTTPRPPLPWTLHGIPMTTRGHGVPHSAPPRTPSPPLRVRYRSSSNEKSSTHSQPILAFRKSCHVQRLRKWGSVTLTAKGIYPTPTSCSMRARRPMSGSRYHWVTASFLSLRMLHFRSITAITATAGAQTPIQLNWVGHKTFLVISLLPICVTTASDRLTSIP